ncbi:MAG: hypothetical protein JWO05_937 [Gemmatimonadetes bacterium]|nr:hypothetical protein [Gemmatimonadota bacterium]
MSIPSLLVLCLAGTAHAQQPADSSAAAMVARADSLQASHAADALALVQRALPALGDRALQATRMKALEIRCWTSLEVRPESLASYAAQGVADAERAGDAAGVARLRVCRGYSREQAGDQLGALDDYEWGVTEARRLKLRDLLPDALVLRGEISNERGDFHRSVEDLGESYKLYQSLGKPEKVRYALNAMANLYADPRMAQYDLALEYYRQLLASNEAAGKVREQATGHFNIGATLERMHRLDDALVEYRRGLALDVRRGDAGEVATDRRAVGIVLYKLGRPADALRELDEVLAIQQRLRDTSGVASARLSRGVALRMLKRTPEAIAELELALAYYTKAGNRRFLEKVHEERALAYADAGRWRDAYVAGEEQRTLQSALETEAREEQSARLRMEFQSQKKDAENRALVREGALRQRALDGVARVRRLQLAVIALAGIIIAALGVFMFRQVVAARRLRTLAMVDELTQVPNRRAILQLATDEWRTANARGTPFALLAIDIDHFKQVNDTLGHEAGDVVLRRVAEVCRVALRPGDHVGRVGGEEFTVVLPGASAQAATEVAERLRSAVAAADFSDVSATLAVTVSIGAAEWLVSDRSLADIQRRADEALYEVKRAGRNQVMVGAAG